jgi:hypothetical protein
MPGLPPLWDSILRHHLSLRIGGSMMDSLIEDLPEDECLDLLNKHHFG